MCGKCWLLRGNYTKDVPQNKSTKISTQIDDTVLFNELPRKEKVQRF